MASTGISMEKPAHQHPQQQQESLKCPRCDSSNTKFCYYNNYSLSQPRHFCKACKRYWTRGGTLRNVPVGGGCRKNKKIKKQASTVDHANPNVQPHFDLSSSSNNINPLFYGLPTNPSDLNSPYPRFDSRVSSVDKVCGYDIGLGFSAGNMDSDVQNDDYRSGFNPIFNTSSVLSSYPIYGSSTMASLIASSFQQQKFISGGLNDSGAANSFVGMKESQNRMDWNFPYQNQMEQIGSFDPSLLWNTTSVGAWLDPSNIGSSVPSLI